MCPKILVFNICRDCLRFLHAEIIIDQMPSNTFRKLDSRQLRFRRRWRQLILSAFYSAREMSHSHRKMTLES